MMKNCFLLFAIILISACSEITGFSPADNEKFKDLFVGMRMQSVEVGYIDFFSSHFSEGGFGSPAPCTGDFDFHNTGQNSGQLELFYDNKTGCAEYCAVDIEFESETNGTTAWFCDSGAGTGEIGGLDWQLIPIPPTL